MCTACDYTVVVFSVWQYSEIALILETQSRQLKECSATTPSPSYFKFIRRGWTASTEHRCVALHVHDLKKEKKAPPPFLYACAHVYTPVSPETETVTAVVAEPVESAPVPEAETVQNGKLTIKFDSEPAFLICVFFLVAWTSRRTRWPFTSM